ncbi:anhydro-N-acetylmuramic acid kinase [Roseibium sp. CAU 1637]|uniref:Anhydro-N-acetylmuramic acid kinase n=1 Tax=Roseibium limicola TaxID=2816037 RepID=A0A939EPL2_9HYPH|nr:anhydro-N-acetylmuramic acid kinase [Roseibium limicola]MBO0345737.1 anhydro-N-acetylmuramic acid kinase [Roseibium limicola]
MTSVIGTISGTSADGIDLAELETDGRTVVRFGPSATLPYSYETRAAVLSAIETGPSDRSSWPEVSRLVTRDHAAAIRQFVDAHDLEPELAVFHGQTVWHDPKAGETVQLGRSQDLADTLGIDVVGDLRLADMLEGGEGAPLVPVYHQALANELPQPLCFLNIGGVSNLTYIDGSSVLAFDIGPGNALLDDWVRSHQAGDFDPSGQISAKGSTDADWVSAALANPFFARPGPKSLDRNSFSNTKLNPGTALEDGAATLVEFTAAAIAQSETFCPAPPVAWLVCGGGRHNETLMKVLAEKMQGSVVPVEQHGFDGDALEAQAMAFLGARLLAGLPTSYPETTGAQRPVVGGRLFTARR